MPACGQHLPGFKSIGTAKAMCLLNHITHICTYVFDYRATLPSKHYLNKHYVYMNKLEQLSASDKVLWNTKWHRNVPM